MNILRNVRWGYTGDGMGCGPCGGFDAVELVVEREEGKLTFVRFDCMGQYAAATITEHSKRSPQSTMARFAQSS